MKLTGGRGWGWGYARLWIFSQLHPLRPHCTHSNFTAHTPTSLHTLWPNCTHSSLLDTLLTAHTPNTTAHTSKLTAHTPTTLFRSIYIRNIERWVPLFLALSLTINDHEEKKYVIYFWYQYRVIYTLNLKLKLK